MFKHINKPTSVFAQFVSGATLFENALQPQLHGRHKPHPVVQCSNLARTYEGHVMVVRLMIITIINCNINSMIDTNTGKYPSISILITCQSFVIQRHRSLNGSVKSHDSAHVHTETVATSSGCQELERQQRSFCVGLLSYSHKQASNY